MAREFRERFGVRWLPPLGFQNTYAIAVRRETAERLAPAHAERSRARRARRSAPGSPPTSSAGPTGCPASSRAYGLRFREVRALLPAVKYQALAAGEVDVIDGYATDGLIARYDLVVLEDDRGFFPPYEAAALLGARASPSARPAAVAALTELSGRLSEAAMRTLNRRVEVDGEPVARVARRRAAGRSACSRPGRASRRGRPRRRAGRPRGAISGPSGATLLGLTARHLLLVAVSLAAAIARGRAAGPGARAARGAAPRR